MNSTSPSNQKIPYVLQPAESLSDYELDTLRILLNAERIQIETQYDAPKGTPAVPSSLGTLFLPLEGLIDVEAEKARLEKELEKIAKEVEKVEKKLGNKGFVDRAPAEWFRSISSDWWTGRQKARAYAQKPGCSGWNRCLNSASPKQIAWMSRLVGLSAYLAFGQAFKVLTRRLRNLNPDPTHHVSASTMALALSGCVPSDCAAVWHRLVDGSQVSF